jgi:hypothetical protein
MKGTKNAFGNCVFWYELHLPSIVSIVNVHIEVTSFVVAQQIPLQTVL